MSLSFIDFIAGVTGGAAGTLAGHPLDTVKVRLQTSNQYRGTAHCILTLARTEGIGVFLKGLSSPLYGLTFINAISFGVYGNVRRSFAEQDSILCHLISGALAGLCQSLITAPVELSKTRVQVQQASKTPDYKTPLDCIKKIYAQQGIRGVYKGLGLTIARDCPAIACYFASYELMVRLLTDDGLPESLTTPGLLLSGGTAGVLSWMVNYPTDVVKTRFQTDKHNRYSGVRHCFVETYREGGPRAFTKGLTSTLIRAFPANAATFFVAEWTYRIYDVHFAPKYSVDVGSLTVEEQIREKSPFTGAGGSGPYMYGIWAVLKRNKHNEYAVPVMEPVLSPHGPAVGGTHGGAPTASFTQFRPPQLSDEQMKLTSSTGMQGVGMLDYR